MAGVFKTMTFLFLLFNVVVHAEDYDVGDDTEWTRPSDLEFYTTWAAGKTFRVGDELEFEFAPKRHDVAIVTQDAYENCNSESPISLMTTPPVKIILNKTGPQYFICTVGDHCRFGQKLAIDVVAAGAGPGAASTPGSSPGAATTPGSSPGSAAGGGATPSSQTPPTGTTGTTTTTPSTPSAPAGNNAAASSFVGNTLLVAFAFMAVTLFT